MEEESHDNIHLVLDKNHHMKELEKELNKAYKNIGKLGIERDFLSEIL